jgi:hypothetical protein
MSVLLLLLGCAKQVTWQVQPAPSYTLPSLEVSVVAGDRACKRVADELAATLSARPGVRVHPGAGVRLELAQCEDDVDTTVELESTHPGLTYNPMVSTERKRVTMRGWASAVMSITSPGSPPVRLPGGAERRERSPWLEDTGFQLPRAALALQDAVRRDLALDLADQLAPLPATIRRTLYRDPEPGTARQLHNQAVDAERGGDLDGALKLARQAYAAHPTADAMRYIEALQEHALKVGYALVDPDTIPSEQR